jgi:hypothetical protein
MSPTQTEWEYGFILRMKHRRNRPDRVMFLRVMKLNESPDVSGWFKGITLTTNSHGERIGRLTRIDNFRLSEWEPDV